MTPNEIFRTAEKYIEASDAQSMSFGAGLPHGINQVCRGCKAGSIAGGQVVGQVERLHGDDAKPFADFYTSGKNDWAAYECHSCGRKWSWYKPKGQA